MLEVRTAWSTPRGDFRLLEIDNVVVRWYSNNNSLTINGSESEDLKSQLRTIVNLMEERRPIGDGMVVDHVIDAEINEKCATESIVSIDDCKNDNASSTLISEMIHESMVKLEERLEHNFKQLVNNIRQTLVSDVISEVSNKVAQLNDHGEFLKCENSSTNTSITTNEYLS